MSYEKELLTWYHMNRRILPWREDPTPYHVYLSEIMLQQTQVDTVRSYYDRFLKAYPTLKDLAKAPLDDVLKLWEGLGYYSRCRNLKKTAEIVDRDYGGNLPDTEKELLALPGIGLYTAHAILSIAYHKHYIAVDGNLVRVYARNNRDNEENPELQKKSCNAFLSEQLKDEDPSGFNQALMDLGEIICLPHGDPLCLECPLSGYCSAFRQDDPKDYPPARKKILRKQEDKTVLVLYHQGNIVIRRRPETGLLAGLYEFISLPGKLTQEEAASMLKEKDGITVADGQDLGMAKHVFSHLVWNMTGYRFDIVDDTLPEGWSAVSKDAILSTYAIASAFKKYKDSL